jgi:hypothetical protein
MRIAYLGQQRSRVDRGSSVSQSFVAQKGPLGPNDKITRRGTDGRHQRRMFVWAGPLDPDG